MKRILLFAVVAILFFAPRNQAFETLIGKGKDPKSTFKWVVTPGVPIPYAIHSSGTPDVGGTGERGQVRLGLIRWNPLSPLKFVFTGTTSAVTSLDLKNGVIFDGANFSQGSSVLAFMNAALFSNAPEVRVEGDLHFNDRDFKWTLGRTNAQLKVYKILPVALHEFGHSVGHRHSAVFDATMFFQNQGDDRGATLHPDDIAGIKWLYAPRQNTLAAPRLITPLNNTTHRVLVGTGTQAASGITFRWEQNPTLTLTAFFLEFAADANFTRNFKRFPAGLRLALFMGAGAKLNALKKIQNASPTGTIFWRVSAKSPTGATVRSSVFAFSLVPQTP